MRDIERVDSAYRRWRSGKSPNSSRWKNGNKSSFDEKNSPISMEIVNIEVIPGLRNTALNLQKLEKEELERRMCESFYFRSRQKAHMAQNCPRARKDVLEVPSQSFALKNIGNPRIMRKLPHFFTKGSKRNNTIHHRIEWKFYWNSLSCIREKKQDPSQF